MPFSTLVELLFELFHRVNPTTSKLSSFTIKMYRSKVEIVFFLVLTSAQFQASRKEYYTNGICVDIASLRTVRRRVFPLSRRVCFVR